MSIFHRKSPFPKDWACRAAVFSRPGPPERRNKQFFAPPGPCGWRGRGVLIVGCGNGWESRCWHNFLFAFLLVFSSFLDRFWRPSWALVGRFLSAFLAFRSPCNSITFSGSILMIFYICPSGRRIVNTSTLWLLATYASMRFFMHFWYSGRHAILSHFKDRF